MYWAFSIMLFIAFLLLFRDIGYFLSATFLCVTLLLKSQPSICKRNLGAVAAFERLIREWLFYLGLAFGLFVAYYLLYIYLEKENIKIVTSYADTLASIIQLYPYRLGVDFAALKLIEKGEFALSIAFWLVFNSMLVLSVAFVLLRSRKIIYLSFCISAEPPSKKIKVIYRKVILFFAFAYILLQSFLIGYFYFAREFKNFGHPSRFLNSGDYWSQYLSVTALCCFPFAALALAIVVKKGSPRSKAGIS